MKVQVNDVTEQQTARVTLKYVDCYYTVDDTDEPIIHLIARDKDGERWNVDVEGFVPYFCVSLDEITVEQADELVAYDHRVRDVVMDDEDVRGNDVARIETQLPKHVRELRDEFDNPLEADVQFDTRFLVDMDIQQCFSVSQTADSETVHVDDVESVDTDDDRHFDIPPKILYVDIEVAQSDDGPAVVSDRGTKLAMNPITAIAAVDGYTSESYVWLLAHDSWENEDVRAINDEIGEDAKINIVGEEHELLSEFCTFIADRQFDVITGWNSDSFDVPYLVNRCLKEKDVTEIFRWSPTRDVQTMSGDGKWLNSDLKGMIAFDMLRGFEKTEFTELDSYSLDHVASEVVGETKVDVGDIDDSWADNPVTFAEYVLLDAELVYRIDRERGILTDGE